MSDDMRRILELLAQGKVTVDEADRLMKAVAAPAAQGATPAAVAGAGERPKPRWVRINVFKQAKEGKQDKEVNIRVPIAVIKSGMRLGAFIPGYVRDEMRQDLRDKGFDVDFSKLDAAALEAVLNDLGEANIHIESGRAHVRITCE